MLSSEYPNFEVIFVDNASTDGSPDLVREMFISNPHLKMIHTSKNVGCAGGKNIGAKYAEGTYIAFLDDDTKVNSMWLNELVKVMETDSTIGAAQCKQLVMSNPKYLENAGHYIDWFGITHAFGHFEEDRGQYDRVYEIFGATGAAFIARREAFQKVRGFDPDFFTFFDDTDLCWRIWLCGYRIVYVPKAIVQHKRSLRAGASKIDLGTNTYLFVRNRMESLLKNYSSLNLLRYLPINIASMLGLCAIKIRTRELHEAKAIIHAILWNAFNLKRVLRKRKRIQRARRISDRFLMKREIIRRPNLRRLLRKASMYMLIS